MLMDSNCVMKRRWNITLHASVVHLRDKSVNICLKRRVVCTINLALLLARHEDSKPGLASKRSKLQLSLNFFRQDIVGSCEELNSLSCINQSKEQTPVVVFHDFTGTTPVQMQVNDYNINQSLLRLKTYPLAYDSQHLRPCGSARCYQS